MQQVHLDSNYNDNVSVKLSERLRFKVIKIRNKAEQNHLPVVIGD